MVLWWKSDFEFLFEGFLSRKNPNKQDLECMMPSVWWPGSREDMSYESSMDLTTTALSEAINEVLLQFQPFFSFFLFFFFFLVALRLCMLVFIGFH